jgi:hypothetical protein
MIRDSNENDCIRSTDFSPPAAAALTYLSLCYWRHLKQATKEQKSALDKVELRIRYPKILYLRQIFGSPYIEIVLIFKYLLLQTCQVGSRCLQLLYTGRVDSRPIESIAHECARWSWTISAKAREIHRGEAELGRLPGMCGVTRYHHQPINPFRTQPRADEIHGVLLANPWLKACYVAAVVTLMISVLTVASTAVSQNLNPLETSSEGVGSHQLTRDSVKTINGPSRRLGGGGVVSLSRLPPLPLSTVVPEVATSKAPEELIRSPNALESASESVRESKGYGDDDYNELASTVHQEEMEDTEDGLLQQGGAHLRIIGETKQKVKQEIERESYSDHAFGQQQGAAPVNKKLVDSNSTSRGDLGTSGHDVVDISDNEVHVVRRKGESREPAIILAPDEAVVVNAPVNGSSSLGSSPLPQASMVAADSEHENASSTAIEPERSLRHSVLRPIVQIPVKGE